MIVAPVWVSPTIIVRTAQTRDRCMIRRYQALSVAIGYDGPIIRLARGGVVSAKDALT
jgi:hypothetical protein